MVRSFIVRIYKTEAENQESAVGIVEDPVTEKKERFRTFDEMKEVFKSMVKGKNFNPERRKEDEKR